MPPLTEIVPETIPESNTQESETLQSLRDTIRRLENRLQSEGSSRNRRRSSSASSMDGCTAKLFKNIPEFTLDFRLQQRQEWILDLEYSFKGAKRRLRRDDQKIIAALPHMSPICRQRWYRHLAEKERDQRRNAEESWQYFTEWTLSLIRNSATLQPDTMSQLQRALSAHKFAKSCRNLAYVFAVVKPPEEVWLPDDSRSPALQYVGEIPQELKGYEDVFSKQKSKIMPPRKATDHAIELIDGETPPYGPIYPLSQRELQVLRQYINENLECGRIRPSKSPAGAPILFVPKKDGGLRLCVDYRGLNKITVKNRYPLPLISEILDRLAGAKFFTKIDIQDAYYRIRLREGDEWKTAFRTRYGHFEYLVVPFGLTNAPATFQSYLHTALYDILDVCCVVYLDDILIFSLDRESHTRHIKQVLDRLRKADLYGKLSKCTFYQKQVEFLGYIVSQDGISMDPQRVNDIVSWEEPKSYYDVQSFLGFCNFYRRFIQNYSRIALPLTSLMKGSKNGRKPGPVKFTLTEKLAFRRLIAAFQSAPLLRHFNPQQPIRIETDASSKGMAGIMSQPDENGAYHLVAIWSRKFSGAELNYSTPDQELYAIVYSFKHWRQYLEARWLMFLIPFDFIIKHRTGKSNPADGPSRKSGKILERTPDTELTLPFTQRFASVESLQVKDLLQKKTQFEPGETPSQKSSELNTRIAMSPGDHRVGIETADWAVWEELNRDRFVPRSQVQRACISEKVYAAEVQEDLRDLIKRIQSEDPETQRRKAAVEQRLTRNKGWSVASDGLVRFKDRLYIPSRENLRQTLINLHHDDPLAGHFGKNRTEILLKRKFHWTNLQRDVADYVAGCPVCQGAAAPKHRPYGTLESLPIPSRPFAELSMDFITGLPETIFKNEIVDSIWVVVDRFSKWSLFFPVSTTINAAKLAELFHNYVELRFGPPNAFHPQTDGQTEPEFACNNAQNATTGLSPFQVLLGYSPNFQLRTEDGTFSEEIPAVQHRIEKLTKIRENLAEHWQNAIESQKKHFDKHHQAKSFKRGDLVRLSTRNIKLKVPARKLAPKYIGPFRVLDAIGKQAYRLSLPNKYDRIHNVFHISLLEPWTLRHQDNADPLPMPDLDDDDEWEVEEVKGKQTFKGETRYLVKWAGWPSTRR
ncbi:RNA-directed DNA polymerase (Reverse transcriptase) [Aspergillus oryzae]|uniref:RNA-directed DNA polymerase (Reverse transcriptase) n=1 Tax=Aspergillus oryzae TaxID=5062 RepID=A0A1S9D9L5_ASPOZ|nr:RNA-directed DNA polymerase (Reverse transcriptase) [Aspergillus oryzae]